MTETTEIGGARLSPPPAVHLDAWRGMLETHARLTRVLDEELREATGLPLAWYDVLVQLHEAGGRIRMHELADRLLLSRSATTRFMDRLEAQGLIERRMCEEDRRGTWAVLTDVGRARLREAARVHLDGIRRRFARHIGEDEARVLAAVWDRIGVAEGFRDPGAA